MKDGPIRHLIGAARVETSDMLLTADEITLNEETGDSEARGNVHFVNYVRGETLDCDRAEYNLDDEEGTFYNVSGTAMSTIQARPGLLTTINPFYFHSKWAERLKDHYILHDGYLTDCIVPHPWWVFKGPEFDIIPGDHAIARRSWFYLRNIPIFYTPWFYKSLKKQPRRSGFLIPTFGDSTLHGTFVGFGYYWAISRSYDFTYQGTYYDSSGLASHAEFRGKISQKADFDVSFFGIDDKQQTIPSSSGFKLNALARADLGDGWEARGFLDYLSSFNFLQQFTQSFNEAVYSETNSVGFVSKHVSDFGINFVASQNTNFESTTPGDVIKIRKLPSAEVTQRQHEVDIDKFPFWVSFDASAGLLERDQPGLDTRPFVQRLDFAPRISTAFRFMGIQLIPTFGIRETQYGSSFSPDAGQNTQPPEQPVINGTNLLRSERDVTLDLILPSLERIFTPPKWMGEKVKHVIEPRITYKYVTGIDNFNEIIRFDETDLLTNTNQLEFSLTNRLLTKDRNGVVTDFLSWQIRYDRYFDPTFGGAVLPCGAPTDPQCQRNVITSSIDLTGFAFIAGPRNYSPVSSVLRIQSKFGFEWRTDYDPLYHRFVNSSVSVDGRVSKFYWNVGQTLVSDDPVLLPNANQIHASMRWGDQNRRGWNYGYNLSYDYLQHTLQFWQAQVTYNTDCCGISVQYRRFSLGTTRDDSQIQAAFAISNIGTFGTLKRQDRTF